MKYGVKVIDTLLVYILLGCGAVLAANSSIVFLTDEHKEGGYLEAVTKEAYNKVGYDVEVRYMPWKRALREVMEGASEALMAAYFTEERAEKMAYSNSIGETEIVFFKLKGSEIQFDRLEDLKPYRIGLIRGAAVNEAFDSADYLNKEAVSTPDINIKKLLKGRIDLLVEQRKVVQTYLREQFPEEMDSLVALEPPLQVSQYYNAFSKNYSGYEQRVKDFNKGLQMIREEGTYRELVNSLEHP